MYMKYTPNMVPRSAFHYVLLLFGTGWFHPSQWRYNEHHSVSNHRHLDCLPKRLFRRILNKTSKLSVTGFLWAESTGTDGFPSQRASNAGHVSIWWRTHVSPGQSDGCLGKAILKNMDRSITQIHKIRNDNHNKTKHYKAICIFQIA